MDKDKVPFFSIVVPIYKTEKELKRCVNSVLEQTFLDYELILVDDGSPDGCGRICDEYVKEDGRIQSIHKANGGLSDARNAGIAVSTGKYIVFLDSDDMWSDRCALEGLYDTICRNDELDVVCFGYTQYNEEGRYIKTCCPKLYASLDSDLRNNDSKYNILKYLMFNQKYYNCAYTKACRRQYIIDNELYFEKGMLSEDISWSGRILLTCSTVSIFPSAFYSYIVRESGSITSNIGRKHILDVLTQIEQGIRAVSDSAESDNLQDIYYEYWAYQYAMMLGYIPTLKKCDDYKEIKARFIRIKFLLKYNHVRKVKAVYWIINILGFNRGIYVLKLYLENRKR